MKNRKSQRKVSTFFSFGNHGLNFNNSNSGGKPKIAFKPLVETVLLLSLQANL